MRGRRRFLGSVVGPSNCSAAAILPLHVLCVRPSCRTPASFCQCSRASCLLYITAVDTTGLATRGINSHAGAPVSGSSQQRPRLLVPNRSLRLNVICGLEVDRLPRPRVRNQILRPHAMSEVESDRRLLWHAPYIL